MKKQTQRLSLDRETLRELDQTRLEYAQGAGTVWVCTTAPTCSVPTR